MPPRGKYFFVHFLISYNILVLAGLDLPLAWPSLKVTAAPPSLAPTKAHKSGRTATSHTALQPPTGGSRTAEEVAEQYRAAMARGIAMARAQSGVDDTSRRGAKEAARPGAEEDAG